MRDSKSGVSGIRLAQRAMLGALTLLTINTFFGCGNRLKDLEGTYYGDLSVIEGDLITTHRVMATIDESSWKPKKALEVAVKSQPTAQNPSQLVALVTLKKDGKDIVIDSTLVPSVPGRSKVKVRNRGACGQEESDNRATPSLTIVCATKNVVSLFATNLNGNYRALLYMSKDGSAAPAVNLPPEGRFTLEEIHKRVREDSYENRLAAEKLYQAGQEAKLARSALLPSISLGDVAGIVVGAYTGFGGAMSVASLIGNFVPFIFPSNWFALSTQKAFYQAEVQSYRTLVANQMNIASDIYHNIMRDQYLLGRLRGFRSRLENARGIVESQVLLGLAPETDLVEYDDLLAQNDSDQSQFRHTIRSQYATLSRGLGLSPRDGVQSLVPVELPDIAEISPIDAEELMAEAMATSMELRQFLFLERGAKQRKAAAVFSFMSPSGWLSFNSGIFHEVRIEKSRLREVRLMREQAERMIAEKIMQIASLHNYLLEQNNTLDRRIQIRRSNLDALEERYRIGGVSILELRTASENLIQLETQKTDAEAALAIVLDKIDRLLMRGPYATVLTMQVGN